MKKKKLQIFDLFAGCGGLSQGFLNLGGFEVPFANEYWGPAQKSYSAAHPKTKMFPEDIKNLTNEKIDSEMKKRGVKKIDLIIGGPPCQGFSMAGARRKDDPRNSLFLEFARIVDHLEPSFFIFENVKGLLTMRDEKGKKVINQIVKEFKKVNGGYELHYKLLNSADYGVPQKRERVILIGTRLKKIKGKRFHPLPSHAPKKNLREIKSWFKRNKEYFNIINDSLWKKIINSKDINNLPQEAKDILNKMEPWETVKDFIGDLEKKKDPNDEFNHLPMKHTEIVKRRMGLIDEGQNIPRDQSSWPKELRRKKFASVYKRLHRNEPACTMVPGHSAFPIHYKFNRSLTVREAARIQTLPDTFKFFGSKTEQCLVVGNAVPPLMSERIAKRIKELI